MGVRPLTEELQSAATDAQAVVRALGTGKRLDLATLPRGALAFMLARAATEQGKQFVIVVPDAEHALRLEADLRFFVEGGARAELGQASEVLHYPGADTTPFVDVAPDQRAAMDRLAVLFHLSQGLPWRLLVVPAHALLRKVPPREALAQRCLKLVPGDLIARDELLRVLIEGGYLRVPLVEDAGTFAVRGGLVDVFPPHAEKPSRIELDDELLVSIKRFDPEDQRSQGEADSVAIHPVRDTLIGRAELDRARERVSDLCDALNLPTLKRKQLVDDITSGRRFIGIESFLPAFYTQLDTLFD